MGNTINYLDFIQNFLYIITKKGEKIRFKLNQPQLKLYEEIKRQEKLEKPVRIIILKARQMGFSTLVEALIFVKTILNHYTKSGIISHLSKATKSIFKMSKRFYDNLPAEYRPQRTASNGFEMVFDTPEGQGLDSAINCMTATDEGVGRGDTYINLHCTETAFWNNFSEVWTSLMQCVPDTPNSMIIVESTANGYNDFKELWDNAVSNENDFVPLFFAWHEMSEYRKRYDGHPLSLDEVELKNRFNLDNDQLQWRLWKIKNDFKGDVNGFKQEFPSYPEEAFLFSGSSIFDTTCIENRLKSVKEPIKRGHFDYDYNGLSITNVKWVDNARGALWIYKDVEERRPYVIGGDTAGDGSDAFTAKGLDNITGEEVFKLKHTYDSDIYARQLYCVGQYYNNALIGIESNYDSFPIKELTRLGYDNQFVRETEDSITGQYQTKYGFRTTTITRPIIISQLVQIVRENTNLINDKETLQEMITFVKNEKGKAQAIKGKHDDLVMATAIAYYIRTQQRFVLLDEKIEEQINYFDKCIKKSKNSGGGIFSW